MSNGHIFETDIDLSISFLDYQTDLLTRARSRLLYQMQASTVLDQFVQAITLETQELFDAIYGVLEGRTLAKATDAQLDTIGKIVGQERINIDGATKMWVETDSDNTPDRFPVWTEGASLYDDTVANNLEYTQLIFAKIFKNHVQGTSVPEVRSFIKMITNESISMIKVAPFDILLVVKENILPNVLSMIRTVWENDKETGIKYLCPFVATIRIIGVVFLPVNVYNNTMAFMPDNIDGRVDYAEAAIII